MSPGLKLADTIIYIKGGYSLINIPLLKDGIFVFILKMAISHVFMCYYGILYIRRPH